ncbi:MAG: DUF1592 domain-containing protein [Polyangia bacterium]
MRRSDFFLSCRGIAQATGGFALWALLSSCTGVVSPIGGSPASQGPPGGGGGVPGQQPTGNPLPPKGGNVGTGGSAGDTSPPTLPSATPVALNCTAPAMGVSPLRRLSHREYDNAIADLLGDKSHPSAMFPEDTEIGLFDNSAAAQTVPVLLAGQYLDSAVRLANVAANLPTLVGCDFAGTAGATCARTFIGRFGRRAFRRPVTADETTRLGAIFDKAGAADKAVGIRAVIAALLASPHFIYRPEFGTADTTIPGTHRLTQFEQASRLASLLWAAGPDDMLLDEAQAGRLATREQIATQARRMLSDPRARAATTAFYDQWLGLKMLDVATKDTAVYKFDDALQTAMREETERFIDNVIWTDDAKLSTLLGAPYSFLNAPLATLYGVQGVTSATTYTKVMLDPAQRAGLLTQASFLTAFARPDNSSPVKRGNWIRRRLLCGDLPDPPNNVPQLPEIMAGVSNRDRFAMHVSAPACAPCHSQIDGLGFGLEAYDGIGRYRTEDRGLKVDAAGVISQTVDINGAYNGAMELSALLGRSTQVRDCVPTQWLRYALARREGADDDCALKTVREAFTASGGNLKELMVTLTQTDAFMNYKPAN